VPDQTTTPEDELTAQQIRDWNQAVGLGDEPADPAAQLGAAGERLRRLQRAELALRARLSAVLDDANLPEAAGVGAVRAFLEERRVPVLHGPAAPETLITGTLTLHPAPQLLHPTPLPGLVTRHQAGANGGLSAVLGPGNPDLDDAQLGWRAHGEDAVYYLALLTGRLAGSGVRFEGHLEFHPEGATYGDRFRVDVLDDGTTVVTFPCHDRWPDPQRHGVNPLSHEQGEHGHWRLRPSRCQCD